MMFGDDALPVSKALSVQNAYLYEMVELTGDFSEILTLLQDNPRGMSVTEIADAAHINRNTVARYMDNLLLAGRVEMRMFGKAKVFFLSKRIPVSAMLNLSSEMVLLTDADLTVIQANEAVLDFLSCTEEDLVGHTIYEGHASPLCNGVLTEQIRTALRGDTVRGELRLFKDGEEKILDQRLYPLVLPDGKPGVTIILDDITEHVQAEAALEQSENMFRRLVETVSDVIWSVDENSLIQYISPQIASVTGYQPSEMIGKRFSDFMPSGAGSRFAWGPRKCKRMTITLEGYKGTRALNLNLCLKRGEPAFHDNTLLKSVGPYCKEQIVVENPKAGEWFTSVFCETTPITTVTKFGTHYRGRLGVLNGVPYKISVKYE